jgi:hypothetical protein
LKFGLEWKSWRAKGWQNSSAPFADSELVVRHLLSVTDAFDAAAASSMPNDVGFWFLFIGWFRMKKNALSGKESEVRKMKCSFFVEPSETIAIFEFLNSCGERMENTQYKAHIL